MNGKTMITCALTGGTAVPRHHPNFPITPKQIADQALEAAEAGAAIVHLHVRHPDGSPSNELSHYREVVDRIRQGNSDVLINLTTGYGCLYIPEPGNWGQAAKGTNVLPAAERVGHIVALKPDISTLDMNTMQIADIQGWERETSSLVVMNLDPVLIEMAATIRAAGVIPEIEVFEAGDLARSAKFIKRGVIEGPGLYTFVLNSAYGLPPTQSAIAFAREAMPPGAVWTAMGVGPAEFPMVAQSYLMGGHARVGLEDNLYLTRGQFAPSNAALVTRARLILESLGAEIATPKDAREIIGLKKK